ncbi:hypothetical protein J6590_058875 [Homalodisca vitripennis]|nr:hypothetical protein J6590_058875 [Homalodisca vitripennis]
MLMFVSTSLGAGLRNSGVRRAPKFMLNDQGKLPLLPSLMIFSISRSTLGLRLELRLTHPT